MTLDSHFAHHRLDVYHLAMELAVGVERLILTIPQGHADVRDQVRRAASATARNIAEGANRWSAKDKAARFIIARGECGECDSVLEMIQSLSLANEATVRHLRALAYRVAAMLTSLIRRQQEPR